MAVLYRLSQNKNEDSKIYGKWFAQAVMTGTVDTNALANIMQRNCTVKKSDIMAVITELIAKVVHEGEAVALPHSTKKERRSGKLRRSYTFLV